MTTKIIIRYEISAKAAKQEFIDNGIFYRDDNYGRWMEVNADLSNLSNDDRRLIWENCQYEGNDTFRYDKCYVHSVCKTAAELIDIIKD